MNKDEFVQFAIEAGKKGHLMSIGDDGCVKEWMPVVIGGGFSRVNPDYLRASARLEDVAVNLDYGYGFRCGRSSVLDDYEDLSSPVLSDTNVLSWIKEAAENGHTLKCTGNEVLLTTTSGAVLKRGRRQ